MYKGLKKIIVIILIIVLIGIVRVLNPKTDIIVLNNYIVTNRSQIPSSEAIINELCYNIYEGRRVGTMGNRKAGIYIADIYAKLNLQKFNKSYYEYYSQDVIDGNERDYRDMNLTRRRVRNIIGIINGKDNKDAVVLSAHFDGIGYKNGGFIKGAVDNASGVATVIECAKILTKESNLDKDIIIACFNGEESGLKGSEYFVKNIDGKYNNLYNINIDCVGKRDCGSINIYNHSSKSNLLTSDIEEFFKKNNINYAKDSSRKKNSDNISFEKYGYANICITQIGTEKYIHTPNDNPYNMDYNAIYKLAECISEFVTYTDKKEF